MMISSRHRLPRWPAEYAALSLLLLAAGCSSLSTRPASNSRRLHPLPSVSPDFPLSERALFAAFYAANGVSLTPSEAEEILPAAFPFGRPDRNAMRRIARQHNRVMMAVKADETFLWEALSKNIPLLILLPTGTTYRATASPRIPVAWDRSLGTLDLLDGSGDIETIPDTDFFARRAPLKHAALILIRPGGIRQLNPTREQQLLLADFWYEKGFYQRAAASYEAASRASPPGTDVDALLGRGNVLFRQGRYKQAIPVFQAALELEPDNPKILNNLAYAMLRGEATLMPALRHAEKAAQLDPDNPVVLETLGSIHLKLGDPLLAAKYLERAWARALKRSPEVQIAIMDQLIRAWYAAQRVDLAWQVAEQRKRAFPSFTIPKDILFRFPDLANPKKSTNSPPPNSAPPARPKK